MPHWEYALYCLIQGAYSTKNRLRIGLGNFLGLLILESLDRADTKAGARLQAACRSALHPSVSTWSQPFPL